MNLADRLEQLRTGALGLPEQVEALCDRIDSLDDRVQVFVPGTYSRERALSQARALLRQYPGPDSRPPLFGLCAGVKDIFRVDGWPTGCGSRLPTQLFEGPEASCVSRLKRAGAIILGKTVTTEFAYFQPGPTRNPHHLGHTPGGSSSGSAAGVAAGFFHLGFGSQTIGSTIRPAAYCGVVGFKPSFDRIEKDGVIPVSNSLDHVGIFVPEPSALAGILAVLCEGWKAPSGKSASGVKAFLGVPQGPYLKQASPDYLDHLEAHLLRLEQAGYAVKRVPFLEDIDGFNQDHRRLMAGEMAEVHRNWLPAHRDRYGPETLKLLAEGGTVGESELSRLRAKRSQARSRISDLMREHAIDCWISPAATRSAPPGIASTGSPNMSFPWSFAGMPNLSLPSGTDQNQLPYGLQLAARFNQDEVLVRLAQQVAPLLLEGLDSIAPGFPGA